MGLDSRVDIYGLGATLYTCLTGEPPYRGETSVAILRAVGGPFPPPSALRSGVPEDLEAAILKAMAADPKQRHHTAEAFGRALSGA